MEAEYSVRPLMQMSSFEVAKFSYFKWPEKIYTVSFTQIGSLERREFSWVACTCPAGNAGKFCKHYRIVMKYIDLGRPVMNTFWIGRGGEINGFYANVSELWREEIERVDGRVALSDVSVHGSERSGRSRARGRSSKGIGSAKALGGGVSQWK